MKKSIQKEQDKFETYLSKLNLRFSKGRQEVFNAAMNLHGHFSAEELIAKCKLLKQKASRATIYRTIKEMVEAGVLRETAFGHKHSHYEHLYDEKPHHHAVCIRSGKMIELPDLGEEMPYLKILEEKGFKVLGHEMHFYGISKECLTEKD